MRLSSNLGQMLYLRSLKLGGSSFVIPRFDHTVVLMYQAKHSPRSFPQKSTSDVTKTARRAGGSVHELVL